MPFVLCLLTIHRFIDKLTLQQYSYTTDSSIHMPSTKSAMKHKGCELTKDFESKRQLCLITAKKLSLYTPNTILITLTVCTETQVVCAYSTNWSGRRTHQVSVQVVSTQQVPATKVLERSAVNDDIVHSCGLIIHTHIYTHTLLILKQSVVTLAMGGKGMHDRRSCYSCSNQQWSLI